MHAVPRMKVNEIKPDYFCPPIFMPLDPEAQMLEPSILMSTAYFAAVVPSHTNSSHTLPCRLLCTAAPEANNRQMCDKAHQRMINQSRMQSSCAARYISIVWMCHGA